MRAHEKKQASDRVGVPGAGSPTGPLSEGGELLASVARGDGHAQRLLANRLVLRVRRAAYALMHGSQDAEDAAQHALIEILRSAHTFDGSLGVERWADRIAGPSITRFARAVRRRNSGAGFVDADSLEHTANQPAPRTLEELLRISPLARREVLLLRHTFGHEVEHIAELTQASLSTVHERLLAARRELRDIVKWDRAGGRLTPSNDTERWVLLRDREALGHALSDAERAEVERIERGDALARAYAAQIHELEQYLSARAHERPTIVDRDLVDRALAAVQVSTQPTRMRASDPDADLALAVDPEGPGWIRTASIGFSVALAVTAAVALVTYEPRSVRRTNQRASDAAEAAIAPTVEALANAHTAKRGGRLKRRGVVLGANAAVSANDELSAADKPGCFVLEPGTEVCLAPYASVRVVDLALQARVIEVLRGRVAASFDPAQGALTLSAGEVRAKALGTVFGLERNEDGSAVRVRVVKGRVSLTSAFAARELSELESALVRNVERTMSLEPLPEGQAQREWELLAAGSGVSIASASRPESAPVVVAAADAPDQETNAPATDSPALPSVTEVEPVGSADAKPITAKSMPPFDTRTAGLSEPKPSAGDPRSMMKSAWELLKTKRWSEAARLYEAIIRDHPKSEEAHVSLVRLGDLDLEYLDQPTFAVASYDRYLREGGGSLESEARFGRIQALARLRKKPEERTAILEFLRLYPDSAKAERLRERLEYLGP